MLRRPQRRSRRKEQGGFALLLIFAMAAAALVMLYLEMPRVAFEHQRNKEAMLVERGEQFTRAITLYYRKFKKLPQNLEELENTNNLRFLRRRYKDPITGEDEWRLVHVDGAGQYLDSLVHKRPGQQEERGPSVLASTIQGIGSEAQYTPGLGGEQDKSPALQRRASDRIIPGVPGTEPSPGNEPGDNQNPQQGRSGDPSLPPNDIPGQQVPGQPPGSTTPGLPALPGQQQPGSPQAPVNIGAGGQTGQAGAPGIPGGTPQPVIPGSPGVAQPGQGTQQPGQQQPGQPQTPGFGFSGGFGSTVSPTPVPTTPVSQAPVQVQPGATQQNRPGAPNSAIDAVRRMLGNPSSGGATGAAGSQALGTGGLVGVASKADLQGILVYNDRTNIKEWEFLFDAQKASQPAAGQQGGLPGQPAQGQPGQPGSNQPGSPFQQPGQSKTPAPGTGTQTTPSRPSFGFGRQ